MGQCVTAWVDIIEDSLFRLFNGDDGTISDLESIISNGKLIEGAGGEVPGNTSILSRSEVRHSITRPFFAFAIPSIWKVSGRHPFIIDSGYDCGVIDPLGEWLSTETMHATAGCYGGKLYYLANPTGDSKVHNTYPNDFSAPPGIEWLDGTSYGGVTLGDLITG